MVLQHQVNALPSETSSINGDDIMNAVVCVVGLGYVGFPLAKAFSDHVRTLGYDVNEARLAALRGTTPELELTSRPEDIRNADFIIICVPTPVTRSKEPDLRYIESAAAAVGRNMRPGAIVVLESTVYPGATEEVVVPILEKNSGLQCGRDFGVGYSPERINPGDDEHSLEKITKIVSGIDDRTASLLESLYGMVSHPYRVRNIRTAEAAKVIENIQRDLNIALMNELAIIFHKLGIDTGEVLSAASTKWNFIRFNPGLVGGHCIPVDPYYLVTKARDVGYHAQVILAGRSINDYMPKYVAEMAVRGLNDAEKVINGSKVLIMGVTYKENVPDTRESPVKDMVRELQGFRANVYGSDPLIASEELQRFGVMPYSAKSGRMDCVIAAVGHDQFRKMSLAKIKGMMNSNPVLIDVRGIFDGEAAEREGFYYRRL